MKWAIISSLVPNFVRHVITSPVPADSISYKNYVKGDTYSQPQLHGTKIEIISSLEERRSILDLGSFPLAIYLPPNSIMFEI